ncbi:MAG: twitch domain-containing radical SAM protein [Cyanobacteria bacterium P01_D01_bin.105]
MRENDAVDSNPQSKHCLTALLGVYASPDGYFYPCCVADTSITNRLNERQGGSFREAFNSDKIKNIRRQLANGEWPDACISCQQSEALGRKSHRQIFNEGSISQHADVTENMTAEGHVDYAIKQLDIRWNNTCNFKCRMCGPKFSSAWERDYAALGIDYAPAYDWSYAVETEEFLSILEEVTSLNFAGGEPLITDAHYQVLLKLIEMRAASKVTLTYTTNLSVLKYKQYDLTELWKHFKQVNLVFSLDGFGSAVEYSREGFNHKRFLKNIESVKQNPAISLYSHCVSSIFSILSIPDYVNFCHEYGIEFSITCIRHPEYYSPAILDNQLKDKVVTRYQQKAKTSDFDYDFVLKDMEKDLERVGLLRRMFKHQTSTLDSIRNKRFGNYFPLFSEWFESIDSSILFAPAHKY